MFWGWTAEQWLAIGTCVLAVATVAVFVVGWIQLISIRDEGRRSRTLDACDRYDFDPILDVALRALRDAKRAGLFVQDPKAFRLEVSTLLNYLDGVAIGIEQGIYIEALARDHLETIIKAHVDEYLGAAIVARMEFNRQDYRRLIKLADAWNDEGTRFKGGFRLWRRTKR